jgi:hypothetical protein
MLSAGSSLSSARNVSIVFECGCLTLLHWLGPWALGSQLLSGPDIIEPFVIWRFTFRVAQPL